VPIGLGTDWTASNNSMDMLAEARLAALVGKMRADDPQALPVAQMVRMLTIDGAHTLGLDGLIGSIEVGKRADLVVFDTNRLEATPAHDPAANLIYSLGPRSVRDVLVDGELLVREGKLTRDDEAALARRHRTHGRPPS
jgi:5-methylthioadenosine/S-adenosylhomocysteine deaminase